MEDMFLSILLCHLLKVILGIHFSRNDSSRSDHVCSREEGGLLEIRTKSQMPDEYTYGIILVGLCNNNQVEESLSLFSLMGNNKLNSKVVYNFDSASKCGFFHDITIKGLQPDVWTYNVMISVFFRQGLVNDAKQM